MWNWLKNLFKRKVKNNKRTLFNEINNYQLNNNSLNFLRN